jgi:hypothetical protein
MADDHPMFLYKQQEQPTTLRHHFKHTHIPACLRPLRPPRLLPFAGCLGCC